MHSTARGEAEGRREEKREEKKEKEKRRGGGPQREGEGGVVVGGR